MVHALKQMWRVMTPSGALLDLRPFGDHYALAVVANSEATPAGEVDAGSV